MIFDGTIPDGGFVSQTQPSRHQERRGCL